MGQASCRDVFKEPSEILEPRPLEVWVATPYLFGNRIGDSGLQAIAKGLADHKNLRELDLCKNGFGDVHGGAGPGRRTESSPEHQGAEAGAGNCMGDSGLQAIAKGLADHKNLRELGGADSGRRTESSPEHQGLHGRQRPPGHRQGPRRPQEPTRTGGRRPWETH